MLNLILFGPPGSGKGTQAEKLVQKYQLLHISTGDLFRYEIGNKTELGVLAQSYMNKGELVPDSVTIAMLRKKVESNQDVKGYIFDGFPRTTPQAQALDALLAEKKQPIAALIELVVPEDEIVRRLLLRGAASGRPDDVNETVIRKRIGVYRAETTPVAEYYALQHKSHKLVGLGEVETIFGHISQLVDGVPAVG